MDWRYSPLVEKRSFTKFEALVDLVLMASHQGGVVGNVDVRRGQLLRSQLQLAERWKWSRTKVRRFLKEAEVRGEIGLVTSRHWSLITICNYDTYQGKVSPNVHQTTQQADIQ